MGAADMTDHEQAVRRAERAVVNEWEWAYKERAYQAFARV
jgi:hypothetical protein